MENKKISIIVIVYKVEPYLEQCLNSIRNQTWENLEIIIVVAKGTDRCEEICDKAAKEDHRIKIISCEAAGAADARNRGLLAVTGDLLSFVDGDDYVEPDFVESMYRNLKTYQADIAVCGRFYEYANGTLKDETAAPVVMDSSGALDVVLSDGGFFLHCWDKLYVKKVFEKMHFPTDHYVEDRIVVDKLLDLADKIVYDSTPKYHFRERSDSLSKAAGMAKKNAIANEELEQYLMKHHPELKMRCDYFMVYEYITSLQNLMLKKPVDKEEKREYQNYLRRKKREISQNPYAGRKIRLKLWMALYCPSLLVYYTKLRTRKNETVLTRFQL